MEQISSIYPDAAIENMKTAIIAAIRRTTGCSKEDAEAAIHGLVVHIWQRAIGNI